MIDFKKFIYKSAQEDNVSTLFVFNSGSSCSLVCNPPMVFNNYYSDCSTLTLGCNLYTDIGLTNPVPFNYYSDGEICHRVTGFEGEITTISSCFIVPLLDNGAGISNSNATYSTGRNATTGNGIDFGRSYPIFGVSKINVAPYQFERSFFSLDTSIVSSPVASAKLFLYITENINGGSVVVMKYTGANPINSLVTADYDSFSFAGNYSNSVVLPAINNWVEIPLNAQALLDIENNSEIKVVIISNGDYTNTAPPSTPSGNDGGVYFHGTQYIQYTLV